MISSFSEFKSLIPIITIKKIVQHKHGVMILPTVSLFDHQLFPRQKTKLRLRAFLFN